MDGVPRARRAGRELVTVRQPVTVLQPVTMRELTAMRELGVTVREWNSAAEASAAIRRLPVRLREGPLAPGGGLRTHEGTATQRGHTLLKHTGKDPTQLGRRFAAEPRLRWSSSFTDRRTAERTISEVLSKNRTALRSWLDQPRQQLELEMDLGSVVGISIARSGTMVSTSRVRMVLRKEAGMLGYYIKTAFPLP